MRRVIWTGHGKRWTDAGLAVPCPTCNVTIGAPCDWTLFKRQERDGETHAARVDTAKVYGFRCVDVLF